MIHLVLMEPVDHTENTILETLHIHADAKEDSPEETVIQVSNWNSEFLFKRF